MKCEYGLWNGAEHNVGILSYYIYFQPLELESMTVEMFTFKAYSVQSIWHTIYKAFQAQILCT
jgi:hypothetical protein